MPKIKTSAKSKKTKAAAATTTSAPVVAAKKEKSEPASSAPSITEPNKQQMFDVTQAIYSQIKNIWAWGKTVPVVEHVLGMNEWIINAILDATLKTDLLAIDKNHAQPTLKKVDDNVFTPTGRMACHVWGIIAPAVHTADEFVVQPIVGKVMETLPKNDEPVPMQ